MRAEVRYQIPVNLWTHQVVLHFHPNIEEYSGKLRVGW